MKRCATGNGAESLRPSTAWPSCRGMRCLGAAHLAYACVLVPEAWPHNKRLLAVNLDQVPNLMGLQL